MNEQPSEGWRVIRIMRVAADDTIHPDADSASAMAEAYRAMGSGASFAIAHTSVPLDNVATVFADTLAGVLPIVGEGQP